MANVLIVVYLLIVLALIAVILLQRSEGGALGIGGGGGGGLATSRSSANLLTRTTAILAVLFFATAIGLTIINEIDRGSQGILESATQGGAEEGATSVLDALNQLQGDDTGLAVPETAPVDEDAPNLAVPTTEAPAQGAGTGN